MFMQSKTISHGYLCARVGRAWVATALTASVPEAVANIPCRLGRDRERGGGERERGGQKMIIKIETVGLQVESYLTCLLIGLQEKPVNRLLVPSAHIFSHVLLLIRRK